MAYADLILSESSLQSYWQLDEAAGASTVADSKGGITGTVKNSPVFRQPTLVGTGNYSAAVTNAGDEGFDAGNVYGFTGTSTFSAEIWHKPSHLPAAGDLFGKTNASNGGWSVFWNGTGFIFWRMDSAGGVDFTIWTPDPGEYAPGLVFHFVATYDGSNQRFYVNGILKAGPTASTRLCAVVANTLRFGNADRTVGRALDGTVDEPAIYNTALLGAQVLAHFQAGLAQNLPAGPPIMMVP